MTPKTLMSVLIVVGLVYFFFPMDLIPDFLGLPGRIDDVAVIGFLTWFYRNHLRQFIEDQARGKTTGSSSGADSSQGRSVPGQRPQSFDPYSVLGIDHSASGKQIKSAYRARMQEYHPDKVAHLGDELQKVAHEKSQEIQRAYQQIGD
jgi:DnaJ-domain-containing protein 1